jgi:inner membrane protein
MAGVASGGRARLRQVAILVAVGMAPDLDLLIGRHSMESHSVGAALLVASVAAWQRWPVSSSRLVIWLAVAAAWYSHPILDVLGSDTSAPLGVMALWPFSDSHWYSGWDVFGPISRRYWLDTFWAINLGSMAREVVILVPMAGAAWFFRRGQAAPQA